MKKSIMLKGLSVMMIAVIMLSIIPGSMGSVLAQEGSDGPQVVDSSVEILSDYYTVEYLTYDDGAELEAATINGPSEPPAEYAAEIADSIQPLPSEGIISSFPSFDWVFGCSAVSAAMIAAYYDNNGYPNMYTGPTNGGVMPLTDTSWSTWTDIASDTYPNNPLIASHKGVDGRTTKGSIDDYWVEYGSSANDPYITGSWAQHTWGTSVGDYMKTSQSAFSNTDGSTRFYNWTSSADKLTCDTMVDTYSLDDDGTVGRRDFYQARGYTVTECWNQKTYNTVSGGFSLADLQAEIDAGHAVFINVTGHSMVAYGYSGSTVYIRNTWDNNVNNTYTMVWDSTPSYSGMDLQSVSIVKLQAAAPSVPTPLAPTGTIGVDKPRYQWSEITSATAYKVQLYKGNGTLQYTKVIYSPYCSGGKCMKKFWTSLYDGQYKFRVKAKVGGVWGAWSAYKWFKVDARSDTYDPKNTISTDTPKFKWSKNVDATSYQIQVMTQAGAWVYKKNVWSPYCTSTTCMKRFWTHLSNGYYKWRVCARVGGVLQPWSAWQNFRVLAD